MSPNWNFTKDSLPPIGLRVRVAWIYYSLASDRREVSDNIEIYRGYFDRGPGYEAFAWQELSPLPDAPIEQEEAA